MKRPVIVWFKQDLRLKDHVALHEALQTGSPLIPLYILDEETPGKWKSGGASKWWLHHSLAALDASLRERGSKLFLRRGKALDILKDLASKHQISALYAHRSYERYQIDTKLGKEIPNSHFFNGTLLFEPEEITTKNGDAFKVFTPFWNQCLRTAQIKKSLPAPSHIPTFHVPSESLDSWQLLPKHPNWATSFPNPKEIGEKAAIHRLKNLDLLHYSHDRDFPAKEATSRLSPHLHFGEISPRILFHEIKQEKFLSELGWREFSYYQLFHFPLLPEKPWRAEFAHFAWEKNHRLLKKWQQGETGYPLVDAGMRELWQTGLMHNRVRMIVASFLIKDLFQPWQDGERWFWDTLLDADLACNAANWQWVAGCGFDASPFFRIFNPTLQGKKFDPEGHYVKKWLPELKNLDKHEIHEPWKHAAKLLYPEPLIDHGKARQKALRKFKEIC